MSVRQRMARSEGELARAKAMGELPSDRDSLLALAELATARGELALGLRCWEAIDASQETEIDARCLGWRVRAARTASLAQDQRAIRWFAEDVTALLELAGERCPFDFAALADSWLRDPILASVREAAGANGAVEALRAFLDRSR